MAVPHLPYDLHTTQCARCGGRLGENQERYCSAACRASAWRIARWETERQTLGLPAFGTCKLCGERIAMTSKTKSTCDENDRNDDCVDAQAGARLDAMNARDEAEEMRECAECELCGKDIARSGPGRPRRFCAPRCKTAFYRAQRALKAGA
ncbi:hypothetical protein ACFUVV_17500 [Streptomyces sp. NPDC057376]|uniref:hypothetical protein n=1 Tax=Streptomyces sp. NPDC057376 TaxID=3346110 RepID=UPI00363C1E46